MEGPNTREQFGVAAFVELPLALVGGVEAAFYIPDGNLTSLENLTLVFLSVLWSVLGGGANLRTALNYPQFRLLFGENVFHS